MLGCLLLIVTAVIGGIVLGLDPLTILIAMILLAAVGWLIEFFTFYLRARP